MVQHLQPVTALMLASVLLVKPLQAQAKKAPNPSACALEGATTRSATQRADPLQMLPRPHRASYSAVPAAFTRRARLRPATRQRTRRARLQGPLQPHCAVSPAPVTRACWQLLTAARAMAWQRKTSQRRWPSPLVQARSSTSHKYRLKRQSKLASTQ